MSDADGMLNTLLKLLGCPNCWEIRRGNEDGDAQWPVCSDVRFRSSASWREIVQQDRVFLNSSSRRLIIDRPMLQLHGDTLWCGTCETEYRIIDGIVQLLPNPADANPQEEELRNFYEHQYASRNQSWHTEDSKDKAEELLAAVPSGIPIGRVLEVGCGAGLVLGNMQPVLGADLSVGTDISRSALSIAKGLRSRQLLVQADAERLPFRTQSIDLVVDADVIEHVLSPSVLLLEQARVSRLLVAKVPVEEAVYTWAQELVGRRRKLHLREKYGHLHHFFHNEIVKLVSKNGFAITSVGSSMIPNRRGAVKCAQSFTYKNLSQLYPLFWGGFAIIGAVSCMSTNFDQIRGKICDAS